MQNLLNLDIASLTAFCESLGETSKRAKMRAHQLLPWIHQAGVADFSQMSNLSKVFREQLQHHANITTNPVIRDSISSDGTRKWLFDVGSNNAIETVLIPEPDRMTLCVSSQAGCAVNCAFCSTGKQGFNRNLSVSEIIGQLWIAEHSTRASQNNLEFGKAQRCISNVVMMGMGEPLLNFENVLAALQIMLSDYAYGLSRRRVTVSTSGVVPMMDRLSQECPVALAVSLHAPNDALRDQLVPLNKKYPLNELMDACRRYLKYAPRDFITFEYCMLDEINDQTQHIEEILDLVENVPCKFNLIPFNQFPNSGLQCSPRSRIEDFAKALNQAGIVTTIRKTRGDDIDAACGQLAGQVQNRIRMVDRSK